MQQLNKKLITIYYESFSFLMPRYFAMNEPMASYKFGNWVIVDCFRHFIQLRTVFRAMYQIKVEADRSKRKILFLIEEPFFPFFEKFLFNQNCLFARNTKEMHLFLNSHSKPKIAAIIGVGYFDNFTRKTLFTELYPIFLFAPSAVKGDCYFGHNSLNFQSAILLLQTMLSEIFD